MVPLCTIVAISYESAIISERMTKPASSFKSRVEMFILINPRGSKAFITNHTCFHKECVLSGSASVYVWAHTYSVLHMHRYI